MNDNHIYNLISLTNKMIKHDLRGEEVCSGCSKPATLSIGVCDGCARAVVRVLKDLSRRCLRCEYRWKARKLAQKQCPRCHSPYWNFARRNRLARKIIVAGTVDS